MNTGKNQRQAKIKTLKIVRRMIVIRKGVEILQKFCLFLQNMNEKFVNRGGGGGLGRDLSKSEERGEAEAERGPRLKLVTGPPTVCHRP